MERHAGLVNPRVMGTRLQKPPPYPPPQAGEGREGVIGRLVSLQAVSMTAVVAVVAIFVLYPIYYLLDASLDVGEADVRPPTAYGFDNFAALLNYQAIMLNTLMVSFAATIMALVFGSLTAWTLSRTNVPFRRTLEQLMAVPDYVTPLLGGPGGGVPCPPDNRLSH